MISPYAHREAGVTYFVPPFTQNESLYIQGFSIVPVSYQWKHKPSGKMGVHIIFLFGEDVPRMPSLLQHWNGTKDWEYSSL